PISRTDLPADSGVAASDARRAGAGETAGVLPRATATRQLSRALPRVPGDRGRTGPGGLRQDQRRLPRENGGERPGRSSGPGRDRRVLRGFRTGRTGSGVAAAMASRFRVHRQSRTFPRSRGSGLQTPVTFGGAGRSTTSAPPSPESRRGIPRSGP